MELFNRGAEHRQQEAEKRRELMGRLRQSALVYDSLVRAALERLTDWAFPDSQVEAFDDKPEHPQGFSVEMPLPKHTNSSSSRLTLEKLDYAPRHCISTGRVS